MIFGYARVSTKDQNLEMQIDRLKQANCDEIFSEKASGKKTDRKEFEKLMDKLRSGDVLVVYSLDRLGRTSKQLIELLSFFKEKNIHLKSLSEGLFDTSTPMGEAIFQIIAILKSMEVNILRERTIEGLKSARSRGRKGGRPKGTYNKIKASAAVTLYNKGESISNITSTLNISRSTLYQYLQNEGVDYRKNNMIS
jgi:DNA invertase Pin-like site-specific DNA recombinase